MAAEVRTGYNLKIGLNSLGYRAHLVCEIIGCDVTAQVALRSVLKLCFSCIRRDFVREKEP